MRIPLSQLRRREACPGSCPSRFRRQRRGHGHRPSSDSWVWWRYKRLEKVSQAGGTGSSPKESAEFLLGKKERVSGRIIWIKILQAGESMKHPEHPGNSI